MNEWPTRVRIGSPPCSRIDLRHGPRADQVVDDLRARLTVQHRRGDERREHRAAHVLGPLVHQEHAIRVPVERHAHVRAVLEDGRLQVALVRGVDRIGRMVRERPVELGVEVMQRDGQPLHHRRHDEAAHAVRGVDRDRQRTHPIHVGERQHVIDVGVQDVPLAGRTPCPGPEDLVALLGQRPDLAETRVLARPASRPARQNFSPLYSFGLWLAVIITPGRSREPEAK